MQKDRKPMVRRSTLIVPLSEDRFIAKAHVRGADAITLDLEDGVAPSRKDYARGRIAEAAAQVGRGGAYVGVRINRPFDLAVRDLEAAVIPGISYIHITKVHSPAHVQLLSEFVARLEAERKLPIGAIAFTTSIETPQAFAQVFEIAKADPRLVCIGLGSEDFTAACDMEPVPEALLFPKQQIILAAHAAGIQAAGYMGSIADYTDLDGFRAVVRRSRLFGFRGGGAIHPNQIPILNEEFGPSPREIERARAIIDAAQRAESEGLGAFPFEGKMIDKPIVDRAQHLVDFALAIEERARNIPTA
jgi:citrate lyase subunit beta / citryl-CoA lyase